MDLKNIVRCKGPCMAFIAAAWMLLPMLSSPAADYYVDANSGKDDDVAYDGSSPEKAKKTLAAVMAIEGLASGDTVWAAEGDYNDGEMKQSASAVLAARVVVPDGVRLEASGRPSETFITGRAASGDGVESGGDADSLGITTLGTNALRCVYLAGTARLRGFTIRSGHTCNASDRDGVEHAAEDREYGGVSGTANSYIEDCVVTGCVCYGSVVSPARYINCSFVRCVSATKRIATYGYFCNCLFDYNNTQRVTMYADALLNCTFGKNNRTPNGQYNTDAIYYPATFPYHNLLGVGAQVGVNGGEQTDCLFESWSGGVTKPTSYGETHVTFTNITAIGLASDYSPASCDSLATDYCTSGMFAANYQTYFPDATKAWHEVTDLKGNPRIMNGVVDAGCYEFDWRPTFSADLAPTRVSVTAADWNVAETADKHISLGTNAALNIAWTAPFAGSIEYSFNVVVSGSGVFKAYANDSASPFAAVTAADGRTNVVFECSGNVALRLVYEGEDGAAEVWNCQDCKKVTITVADKGVGISGDFSGPGEYEFSETKTLVLTRAFDSTHLSTGIITNGTFVAWEELPAETFTYTVRDNADSIEIEAVYAEHQTWYVDDASGDDANSGFLPSCAKKTLVGVSTNGVIASGDIIMVLPGVYDEGEIVCPGTQQTISNRVYVPAGVRLVSRDGATATHIVGKASPNPTHSDCKLGPGAVRCVYLGTDASVEGFTIRDGHTHYDGATSTADYCNGAVFSSDGGTWAVGSTWIVDCVVSNCYGSWRSVTTGGSAVRSKFVACRGVNYDACISGGNFYNCYFGELTGSYGVYAPNKLVNCTLGVSTGGIRNPNSGGSPCWNCLILGPIHQGGTFHRCVIASEVYSTDGGQLYDEDCLTTLTREKLNLDAENDYRPNPGSVAIDFGKNDYLANIPEAYRTSAYPEGQRIYNGAVDAGCFEHDARPDFSAALGGRIAVVEATSNVVETAASAVRIGDGQSVVVTWAGPADGPRGRVFPFCVSGGELTVRLNGVVVARFTADGSWRWDAASADDEMTFSFSASEAGGHADLLKTASTSGFVIRFL